MSNDKLTPKEKFDTAIKNNLSGDLFPYIITEDGKAERKYYNYYSKAAFSDFVDEMKTTYPDHYAKFKGIKNASNNAGGKGGELDAKKGKYGLMPPKMASVASSSRFCYLALRDGVDTNILGKTFAKNEVEFEKECEIFATSKTAPQLDAYIEDEKCDIFIEAKCHEIFDSHKPVFRNVYWDYFKNNASLKDMASGEEKPAESFTVSWDLFDIKKKSTRFDVKQFVCHLLGIKEHQKEKGKNAKLVYMFFKPVSEDKETAKMINSVFEELKTEIRAIFECKVINGFCNENNIELMAIAQENKTMEKLDSAPIVELYVSKSKVSRQATN